MINVFDFDELNEIFQPFSSYEDMFNEESAFGWAQATLIGSTSSIGLFVLPFGISKLNKYLYTKQKKNTLKTLIGKETDPIKKEKLNTQLSLATKQELKELSELKKAETEGKIKYKELSPEEKEKVKEKALRFREKLKTISKRKLEFTKNKFPIIKGE